MSTHNFPFLEPAMIADTRDTCHAYAQVLGGWIRSCRPRRKHWWNLCLSPSLGGVATGPLHADGVHFALELDLAGNHVHAAVANGERFSEPLGSQTADQLADALQAFLLGGGVSAGYVPGEDSAGSHGAADGRVRSGYSAQVAADLAQAWREIVAALADFQSGIIEETSPINLWPGHFDLAMLVLGKDKVVGQDPADEEYSDKQMNFGFSFGDAGIPEPYFFVTAYPQPEDFPPLPLVNRAYWHSKGFGGAVLRYGDAIATADPTELLRDYWQQMLDAGREQGLLNNTES
ncbi:hypothetical protein KUV95_16255 [Microbulbifer agarilyticus]|uniref:DUF5996 family protein n=1 Tax=Microbulbifer agarilyticus TaxID=260552 RepID=UPI001C93CC05|nr:DUF5996 family protein [Microbulbifer agarilyticus]MBY6213104.1 hypothetical protein [Microbulbifer agarilyticus]